MSDSEEEFVNETRGEQVARQRRRSLSPGERVRFREGPLTIKYEYDEGERPLPQGGPRWSRRNPQPNGAIIESQQISRDAGRHGSMQQRFTALAAAAYDVKVQTYNGRKSTGRSHINATAGLGGLYGLSFNEYREVLPWSEIGHEHQYRLMNKVEDDEESCCTLQGGIKKRTKRKSKSRRSKSRKSKSRKSKSRKSKSRKSKGKRSKTRVSRRKSRKSKGKRSRRVSRKKRYYGGTRPITRSNAAAAAAAAPAAPPTPPTPPPAAALAPAPAASWMAVKGVSVDQGTIVDDFSNLGDISGDFSDDTAIESYHNQLATQREREIREQAQREAQAAQAAQAEREAQAAQALLEL